MLELIDLNESLISLTLKATSITLFALMLSFVLRRNNASLRSHVWSFSAIVLLLFPFLSGLLPAWEVSFLATEQTFIGSESESVSYLDWIYQLWIVGFSLSFLKLCVNLFSLARLESKCGVVKDSTWLQIAEKASKKLSLKRKVTLLVSDKASMPMTWGFLNPKVLIPQESYSWSDEQKEMVLLHEFEHIYRKDWIIQILSSLASCIHWFNPMAWLVTMMIKLEREKACDDAVLRVGASPSEYAETLLNFSKMKREDKGVGLACALQLITGSQLQSRIQSILNSELGRKRISNSVWALLIVSVFLCFIPIVSATSHVESVTTTHQPFVEMNKANTKKVCDKKKKSCDSKSELKKKKPCTKHKKKVETLES